MVACSAQKDRVPDEEAAVSNDFRLENLTSLLSLEENFECEHNIAGENTCFNITVKFCYRGEDWLESYPIIQREFRFSPSIGPENKWQRINGLRFTYELIAFANDETSQFRLSLNKGLHKQDVALEELFSSYDQIQVKDLARRDNGFIDRQLIYSGAGYRLSSQNQSLDLMFAPENTCNQENYND